MFHSFTSCSDIIPLARGHCSAAHPWYSRVIHTLNQGGFRSVFRRRTTSSLSFSCEVWQNGCKLRLYQRRDLYNIPNDLLDCRVINTRETRCYERLDVSNTEATFSRFECTFSTVTMVKKRRASFSGVQLIVFTPLDMFVIL